MTPPPTQPPTETVVVVAVVVLIEKSCLTVCGKPENSKGKE